MCRQPRRVAPKRRQTSELHPSITCQLGVPVYRWVEHFERLALLRQICGARGTIEARRRKDGLREPVRVHVIRSPGTGIAQKRQLRLAGGVHACPTQLELQE